jgi:acetyltransferase-like isoleucine patch superfamily enzyme
VISSSFLSSGELSQIGLKGFGEDCQIDSSVHFINPGSITLGSRVRIDAFSILSASSGFITLGDRVHISHGSRIYGAGGVRLGLASGLSSGSAIYSQTDDFVSGHLAHPTVPTNFRNVHTEKIDIGDFCIIGANSILLPGANMSRGSALGALSLLKGLVGPYEVFGGSPARKVGNRDTQTLESQAREIEKYSG